MKWAIEQKILTGFVAAVALMVAIGVLSYSNTLTSRYPSNAAEQTLDVALTLSTMQDAEMSQRGYLITGADRYLVLYSAARASLTPILTHLQTSVRDDPLQQAQFSLLTQEVAGNLQTLQEAIDLRRTQGFAAAQARTLTDQGNMAALRVSITDMLNRARGEEQQQERAAAQNVQGTVIAFILLEFLAFGLLGLVYHHVRRDLAHRRRAEQVLLASHRRYAGILANAEDAIISMDPAQRITLFNHGAEQIFGFTAQEMLGQPLDSLLSPRFVATHHQYVVNFADPAAAVHKMGGDRLITAWRRDGSEFPAEASISKLELDGEMVFTVTLRDVTVRKQTEEALRESEARYRSLIETSPDSIILTGPQGAILLCNQQAVALRGYARQEDLLGQNGLDFIQAAAGPEALAAVQQSLAGGVLRNIEYTLARQDGTAVPVEASVSLVASVGRATSFLIITRDITERKRAEEARLAQEAAEEANRAKSEFLSRMSHELRTPLNAILGFGQLLEMGSDLTPAQCESIDYILKAGRHLLALINEVLDIARIEAGRLLLSPEPVALGEIVRESLAMIGPLAVERHIQIQAEGLEALDQYVLADRQRLKQVLLNLLSNAIKYNRIEGRITLSWEEHPGAQMRLTVRDTGPGLAPDKLARLFTPFDRLGAEQSAIEGTGLGLALSQRLMLTMGGLLGAESTPGRGSAFWIELPLVESHVARLERLSEELAVPVLAPTQQYTVLFVDDNLSNLRLIERILENRLDIKILPALQGRQGLELARQHQPDLILLDLHLPDISGVDVLRSLREDPRTRRIPVIIVSADASPGQIERLRQAGAFDYLTKPFRVQHFLALLNEGLRAGTVPAPSASERAVSTPVYN